MLRSTFSGTKHIGKMSYCSYLLCYCTKNRQSYRKKLAQAEKQIETTMDLKKFMTRSRIAT